MYFANATIYTWSYAVADWAWEPEVAANVAASVADTVSDALAASESASTATQDQDPVLDAEPKSSGSLSSLLGKPNLPDALAKAQGTGAFETEAAVVIVTDAPLSKTEVSEIKAPVDKMLVVVVRDPEIANPEAANANDKAPSNADRAAVVAAAIARGRWVLKGHHLETYYTVVSDPIKEATWRSSFEQSDHEVDTKARARKPRIVPLDTSKDAE